MRELRILIADDHALIRRGVCDLIATRPAWQVVGEACDGAEAVAKARSLRPDIAILDFSMPVLNGPGAAAQIKQEMPETGVVVLTMHESEQVIREVLQAGVDGLVLKTDADRNLLGALDAVSYKGRYFPDGMLEGPPGTLLKGRMTPAFGRRTAAQLTAREREIMCLLADGMTSKAAAIVLRISIRTIETHRININRKLGFNSIADLVRYAMRSGMVGRI